MFQFAVDLTFCASFGQGHRHQLLQRAPYWYGFPHNSLWNLRFGPQARRHGVWGSPALHSWERSKGHLSNLYHSKRLHKAVDLLWKSRQAEHCAPVKSNPSSALGSGDSQTFLRRRKRYLRAISKPTQETEVIVWGSSSPLDPLETSTFPGTYESTTTSALQRAISTTTTMATTTARITTTVAVASTTVQPKGPGPGFGPAKKNPSGVSTLVPPATSDGSRKEVDAPPPRLPGDSSGLAVHQIITITVSLIMVIAALITTLVLKNCCAQSGNTRRNSHQRKINQQEESCQNLTDFTPARVPSTLDIFTAYNETLQCSHECVRTPVPVYPEETILSPGDYKSSYNGNRIPLVKL